MNVFHSIPMDLRSIQLTFHPLDQITPGGHLQQERKDAAEMIFAGFTEVSDAPDPILSCPFADQQNRESEDCSGVFSSAVESVLSGGGCGSSASELHALASVAAARDSQGYLHRYIRAKLFDFADSIPGDMAPIRDAREIGDFWARAKAKVNFVTAAFSPLCLSSKGLRDFEVLFEERLASNWREHSDTFEALASVILAAYRECRETGNMDGVAGAFRFARESGVFYDIFVGMFTRSVVEYLEPIMNEWFEGKLSVYLQKAKEIDQKEQELAKPFIGSSAVKDLAVAINDLVFSSKLEQICKGLKILIDECDVESVDLCAKYARATDHIKEFTRELSFEIELVTENCFKLEHPIKEVMRVHDAVTKFCAKSFSTQHSRTLRMAFDKGLNTSTIAAKMLAEEIHQRFITEKNMPKEEFDRFISLFRVLNEKDVFEANHHMLMCRRILMMKNHIVQSDELFLDELREQCGPDYTQRLDAIFKDLQDSTEATQDFRKKHAGLMPFTALVIRQEAWPRIETTGKDSVPPPHIASMLHDFTMFYLTRNKKRKVEWNMAFTRVKLSVRNVPRVSEIRCNGLYGLVFLEFNTPGAVSLTTLEKRLGLPKDQIEALMKVLKSRQFGKLVTYMHSCYRLNMENTATSELLSLPFTFPSLPKLEDTSKSAIQQSRAAQVEAAVMLIMKKERSMEKGELKAKVKDLLTFRLEDELYENRLVHLEKISLLKLDPSGHVHYLP